MLVAMLYSSQPIMVLLGQILPLQPDLDCLQQQTFHDSLLLSLRPIQLMYMYWLAEVPRQMDMVFRVYSEVPIVEPHLQRVQLLLTY